MGTGNAVSYRLGRDLKFNEKIIYHWQRLMATYSKRGTCPVGLEDSNFILHPLRKIKSEAEITMLKKAAEISVIAHQKAKETSPLGVMNTKFKHR